jgi:hypothetical protein
MLFLLWFDAIFSRPYHRIENAVWMSLAFALANRSIIQCALNKNTGEDKFAYKCFGGFVTAIALCGFIFLGGGMYGDHLMYRALYPVTTQAKQSLLQKAGRFLMSREDALEQMANLHITEGEMTGDNEAYIRGISELYYAYLERPNSERLYKLFNGAKNLESGPLLEEVIKYLPRSSIPLR